MGVFTFIKTSISDFLRDDAMTLGAALAFYTALSLSPLLIILLSVASFLGEGTKQGIVRQISEMVGPQAASVIETIIRNVDANPGAGSISAIIGTLAIIFSATGVLAALQKSLNRIWNIESKPGGGVGNLLRKRLLSFGMILAIGFLLIVSLTVSTALNLVFAGTGIVWQIVNYLVTPGVFVLLFALIFRYLPDANIAWKNVWVGAAMTAVLFAVGIFAIGQYFRYSSIGSAYGAAGSLLVLLVWVYYSSLILFFGAEMTQVYSRKYGSRIQPDSHADWIDSDHQKPGQETKKAELTESR